MHPDGLFMEHSKKKTAGALKSGEVVNWAITEVNMQPVNHNYSTSEVGF